MTNKEVYDARIAVAIKLLEEKGLPSYQAYSPLRRLLRKTGVIFRPFYFLSKQQMTWLMCLYSVVLSAIANILNGRPPERVFTTAVLLTVIGYFIFRSYFGWRLKQLDLPAWEDIQAHDVSQPK
ncbi:DUF6404 family protein [Kordiimonas laminariae]|uniref:DUF6404 family protein n=1 Tax=Kordiimonas laminariae TaxID=2917717 RepID=UPI001FF3906F|nr:DUF6404 family protein [Kordiimonas laminariae]MCK0068074.1 DUF6404 family protein [Kordiimonas laminariae]